MKRLKHWTLVTRKICVSSASAKIINSRLDILSLSKDEERISIETLERGVFFKELQGEAAPIACLLEKGKQRMQYRKCRSSRFQNLMVQTWSGYHRRRLVVERLLVSLWRLQKEGWLH